MRRIAQHKRIWIGASQHGYRSGRRRASVSLDWAFWIPLIGAALFLLPLLGQAVASSFPTIEPRPLTTKEAYAAVTPLKFHLGAIAPMASEPAVAEAVVLSADEEERAEPVQAATRIYSPAGLPLAPAPGWRTDVLRNAYVFLGTTYKWGGERPDGFDCSGFVKYVMEKSGILLPRTMREQLNVSLPVAESQIQPGDLVFFRGPDHVGIYAGGGMFVHASSGYRRVTISSLNGNFYRRRFIGSGRVTATG